MSSIQKLTVEQVEEALRDNPKYLQVIMEQNRYKQQCRLRALDLAFQGESQIVNPLMNQSRTLQNPDYLGKAERYYEWLIKILPEL